MAFEHKENMGSLFKNEYKKEAKHPDYKGEINVGGTLMDIAAWIKEGQSGKFMSVKISDKYVKPGSGGASDGFDDSDIPFNRITNEYVY